MMQAVVEHAEELNKTKTRQLEFVACTNLTLVSRDQLKYCRDHGVTISTSLDGPEDLHNRCRSMEDGKGSYRHVMKGIEMARDVSGSGLRFRTHDRHSFQPRPVQRGRGRVSGERVPVGLLPVTEPIRVGSLQAG